MKLTMREAELLRLACETRVRVVTGYLQHPVIAEFVYKPALCAEQEEYIRLMRKIEASRKATLRRELKL